MAAHLGHGRKTVTTAATPVQLTQASCTGVIVRALTSNTAVVTIGGDNTVRATVGASQTGLVLAAGVSTEVLPVDDVGDIWIDAATNGEGVTYIYFYTA